MSDMTTSSTETLVTASEPTSEGIAATEPVVTTPALESAWTSSLSEEYRNDPSITKYKSMDEFAKGYKNVNELVGKSIRLPDPTNKEELNKFYSKLGRPESADKYEINVDDNSKQVVEAMGDSYKEFLKSAHESGLTSNQVSDITKWYAATKISEANEKAQEFESTQKMLKEVWKADYDNNLKDAGAILGKYSTKYGADAIKKLADTAGNNPAFVSMLHDLAVQAKASGEHLHVPSSGGQSFGISSEGALSKIKEIRNNPAHAYWNDADKEHKQAVAEMDGLYKAAYPNKAAKR